MLLKGPTTLGLSVAAPSQQNDIQYNDTQHKGLIRDTQHKLQSNK
jgi:hypothetical protein